MKNLFPRVLRLMLVAALALTFATSALAQHAAKGDNGVSGQQVAKDNATGKLRQPSADEAQQLINDLAPMLSHSTAGLNVIRHDDGTLSVDLQDRFASVMVAKVGPDGKVQQRCVTNIEEAKQFFVLGTTGVRPASQVLEEK